MSDKLSSAVNRFSLSSLTSLQLFQLARYATFLAIGIGFAKLQLPLSNIGNFETFIMLSGMVSFFWVSGMINTMLSLYPKKTEAEQKELLFCTFISLVLFSVLATVFLFAFSGNLLSFLDKQAEGNMTRLVIIYVLLNCPSFLVEYILFLNGKKKATIYYALLSSFFTLAVVFIPAMLGYGIEYCMKGLICVAGIKFIVTLFLLNRFASFGFNLQLLASSFRLSLPLILSLFVSGSAEYIDGIIVKAKFDDVFFAVFRYGAKELPVLLIIANTFSTAMIPAIANNLNEGLMELKRKSAQLMHFFFPLTIVLMLGSRFIFQYAFNENFIGSALIFNVYLLLIIPRVLFPQTILTGIQQTKFLFISSVIEIVLNVSLSIWLAGKLGLPGIALGTLIAYSFDKVFLMGVNYFVHGIKPSQYLKTTVFCMYSIACCIAFGIGLYFIRQ